LFRSDFKTNGNDAKADDDNADANEAIETDETEETNESSVFNKAEAEEAIVAADH
jgi:hypothetical protein